MWFGKASTVHCVLGEGVLPENNTICVLPENTIGVLPQDEGLLLWEGENQVPYSPSPGLGSNGG